MAKEAAPHSTASICNTVGVRTRRNPVCWAVSVATGGIYILQTHTVPEPGQHKAYGTLICQSDRSVAQKAAGNAYFRVPIRSPLESAVIGGCMKCHHDIDGCALL